MRENNGTWTEAILIFAGVCVLWVLLAMTSIGRAILDVLLTVNSIGV